MTPPNRLFRRLTRTIHAVDHAVGRLARSRRILIELRTPVYQAVLGPVCEALHDLPRTSLFYTSEYPDRIMPLVDPAAFRTHAQVEWSRFDLYLNADPWAAARLRRCARRINFFHGVAGKYDLDRPAGLPMGFEYYDRVAFINRDRMDRYLDAGVVTTAQALLVGYPKLDRLASGRVDGKAVRTSLDLDPARPTALYAPTYSPASSLHLAGECIIRSLESAGFNVIVKLHDRSLDPDPRYSGGIDWRARMRALEQPRTIRYVEGPDASPYLAAADVMVTDHSSVGFEYLVLDRPLIVFDTPGLAEAARINPEKLTLLRSAASVVRDCEAIGDAARVELNAPGRLSPERRRVAGEMFYEPGTATDRAVAIIRKLLGDRSESPQPAVSRSRSPSTEKRP
ncbi:MAG: CDP-glycerol glycerophosphotransferase family protein [Acidobacteriota bacterium]